MKLLTLPVSIINLVEDSKISVGHARALIGLGNVESVVKKIMKGHLSVRQTELLVKRLRSETGAKVCVV